MSDVLVHNCGYRGGVGALEAMGALKMGLTPEELPDLVKAWREANPKIKQFWFDLENAAVRAVNAPNTKFSAGEHITFFSTRTAGMNYLFMVLPSGRRIAYPQPQIQRTVMWKRTVTTKTVVSEEGTTYEIPDKQKTLRIVNPSDKQILDAKREDEKAWVKDGLTYWGAITQAKWGRVSLHGGVLAENCTMGTATDIMACGASNAERNDYRIRLLVHDEAISAKKPGQTIEKFVGHLTSPQPWAGGLPITAEGEAVRFYKK